MGRLCVSIIGGVSVLTLIFGLAGCGSQAARTVNFAAPANISLSPANSASMDVGGILGFTATPRNSINATISTPVSFQSSNTAVLTIASNGLACAGTWNSLSSPQICTPGPVGTAQVTATAQGISSPPTTVYVHQHIQNVSITVIPGQQLPNQQGCISKDQVFNYQASAFTLGPNGPVDITPTVGPFTWQTATANVASPKVATVANPITGLLPGQVQVTAHSPGTTAMIASVSGVNSAPLFFNTCAVQSIQLTVDNNAAINQIVLVKGTSKTVGATVTDVAGIPTTGAPLTWSSSNPASVTVSSSGAVSTPGVGGASVIASCTPPTCNIGLTPLTPIYPETALEVIVTPPANSTTPPSSTLYASSTGCGVLEGCVTILVPITIPANTVGNPISLPATPNSLMFDRQGRNAYLGTNLGEFGTKGLMVLSGTGSASGSENKSAPGTVLAISPDGSKVIVSDTADTPNQVFIVSGSGTGPTVALNISGATAAAFSPDNLKAFIVAGQTLYIYSALETLHSVPLGTTATDVAFLASGLAGYIVDSNDVTFSPTCGAAMPIVGNTTAVSGASMIRPLPNALPAQNSGAGGNEMLVLAPPNAEILTATVSGNATLGSSGCPVPRGLLTISNSVASPVNFGQGNFTAKQLIVSPDGSRAYVLTDELGSVLVYNISDQIAPPAIGLVNNATPLAAGLSPDGSALYVGASDGEIHMVDTTMGIDIQQISLPITVANPLGEFCTGVTFPLQTVVNITAASQNVSNTSYTYTLASGPGLQAGKGIAVTGMANAGNNGNFLVAALGGGTFTVVNASGARATGQNGTGTATTSACDPDLIAVKP
jgi:trimeric autotransporter adhesin